MCKSWIATLAVASGAALSGSALANDTLPLSTRMLCASRSDTVTDLIRKLEPKAVITDWKSWWESQLREFADFFDKESEAAAPPKKNS